MICYNCSKSNVCKHYEYLQRYPGLKINECYYKSDNVYSNNNTVGSTNINTGQINPNLISREIISEAIEKINNSNLTEEEKNTDFRVVCEPSELIECPNCNSTAYPEDFFVCEKCSKTVCLGCATREFDCNKQRFVDMCDTCWDKNDIEKTSNISLIKECEEDDSKLDNSLE